MAPAGATHGDGAHSSAIHSAPDGGAYLQISPPSIATSTSPSHGARRATPPAGGSTVGTQRHARRLHLRQAGFPSLFPGQTGAGARRSSSGQALPIPTAVVPREAAVDAHASETRRKSTSPSSPGILQEISNQATVRRVSGRSLLSSIFHHPSRNSVSDAGFLIFDDESARPSRSVKDPMPSMIGEMPSSSRDGSLRLSGNRQMKAGKLQRKSRSGRRSISFDAGKYIEHLEMELVSVNSRLDAIASPSISRSQSAKMRTLNRQTQSLRKEVADWEKKFEERVSEHLFDRTRIESSLKAKINELRDEIDSKNVEVTELQREVDLVHEKLAASEALESDLSRRIDVLTQLLAQSPTRSGFSNISPTMGKESTKRAGRPTSMLLPPLKTSVTDLGYNDSNETPTRTGRNIRAAESPSFARRRSEQLWNHVSLSNESSEAKELAPLPELQQLEATGPEQAFSDTSRGISDLSSMQSPSSSRPTSFMSNSSVWSAWGGPIQAEIPLRTESKSRRMRRFVNGSNALKPLLLPASTGVTEPNSPTGELPERVSSEQALRSWEAAAEDDEGHAATTPLTNNKSSRPNINETTPHLDLSEENFYWRLLVSNSPTNRQQSSPSSPLMASSPLLNEEFEKARKPGNDSPSTPLRFPWNVAPETSASSENRTVRIQTPDSNLDALLMDDTPSKISNRPNLQQELQNIRASLETTPIRQSSLSIYAPCIPNSCVDRITHLMMALRRETLQNMKTVLMRSWAKGTSGFSVLGWWLLGLVRSRNPFLSAAPLQERDEGSSKHRHGSVDITLASSGLITIPEERFLGMPMPRLWSVSRSPNSAPSVRWKARHHCPDCEEPAMRRNLRLWCKLSLTIVLALGIAILHGPEEILEEREKSLRARKSCPELKA